MREGSEDLRWVCDGGMNDSVYVLVLAAVFALFWLLVKALDR